MIYSFIKSEFFSDGHRHDPLDGGVPLYTGDLFFFAELKVCEGLVFLYKCNESWCKIYEFTNMQGKNIAYSDYWLTFIKSMTFVYSQRHLMTIIDLNSMTQYRNISNWLSAQIILRTEKQKKNSTKMLFKGVLDYGHLSESPQSFICMSLVVRKPVLGVSDQVPHWPGCTATEDG